MDPKTRKIVEDLEKEREELFRRFIEYSDLAEKYNEKAYDVTCQIECINLALRQARDLGIIDPAKAGVAQAKEACHVPRIVGTEEEKSEALNLFWETGGESEGEEE